MTTGAVGTGAVTVSLVVSVMGMPPLGAGRLSVSVPIVVVPPTTGFGCRLKLLSSGGGGVSIRVAGCVIPFNSAVMLTEVVAVTVEVKTLNVTLVNPGPTTTGEGTTTNGLLLIRSTGCPETKAGAEMVTIP